MQYCNTFKRFTSALLVLAILFTTVPFENTIASAEPKFADVKESDWYYDDIQFVLENGLMDGVWNDSFEPKTPVTRAMLVTVLWRMEGEPKSGSANIFDDVKSNEWYSEAVSWAHLEGLVLGMEENLFAPVALIRRQDMAVIVGRYLDYINLDYSVADIYTEFEDEAAIPDYAKSAIQNLYKLGIINGREGNTIDPQGQATRAEIAAITRRTTGKINEFASSPIPAPTMSNTPTPTSTASNPSGGNSSGGGSYGDNSSTNNTPTPTPTPGFLPMGMNAGGIGYYFDRNLMFNDIMKTSATIITSSWGTYPADKLRPDGYPVGFNANENNLRATIRINSAYEGEYVFLYDGDGDFSFSTHSYVNGDFTFPGSIEVLETKPNAIQLRLKEIPLSLRGVSGNDHRYFNIVRSNPADPVHNIRIIPKEFENNESEMPLFNQDFLDGLKDFNVIRFMDAVRTNGSTQKHWDDRPKVGDFSYTNNGLPIEYLIELSNTLNVDAWFCVPHMASDDYIQKMAQLIKERLNPNLKAYIEYSNEIWHKGFEQGKWVDGNAQGAVDSYVSSELAALRGKYSETNHLKQAYMMRRTFRIFESVFSGADRNRLVTVGVAVPSTWSPFVEEIFDFLETSGDFPDAIATSGYFGFADSFHTTWNANPSAVTPDDIINAVESDWNTHAQKILTHAAAIKARGAKIIVYEGGQHMQPYAQGDWSYNQAVYDAQISPRMYDLYMKNFHLFADAGCEMFVNFSYVGYRESRYGSWGVLENLRDIHSENLKETSPKYKAILDANIKLN